MSNVLVYTTALYCQFILLSKIIQTFYYKSVLIVSGIHCQSITVFIFSFKIKDYRRSSYTFVICYHMFSLNVLKFYTRTLKFTSKYRI